MQAHNIGQNKASVKVNNNPGGQSNFSLYWNEPEKTTKPKTSNIQKYHNETNFSLGADSPQKVEEEQRQRRKEEEQRKQEEERKKEEINNKLPTYDPKKGAQTSIFFGNEPTDYRKKDEVFTSVKVKNPPGGRSNIQFG